MPHHSETTAPPGHSHHAHARIGWCAACPDRDLSQEALAWRALLPHPDPLPPAVEPKDLTGQWVTCMLRNGICLVMVWVKEVRQDPREGPLLVYRAPGCVADSVVPLAAVGCLHVHRPEHQNFAPSFYVLYGTDPDLPAPRGGPA